MSVLGLLLAIVLIVFALYIVQTFLPAPWKTPVLVLVVIVALVWVLSILVPGLTSARIR